jgi:hypothetical protein
VLYPRAPAEALSQPSSRPSPSYSRSLVPLLLFMDSGELTNLLHPYGGDSDPTTSTSTSAGAPQDIPAKRKGGRLATACKECRRLKSRCDGQVRIVVTRYSVGANLFPSKLEGAL